MNRGLLVLGITLATALLGCDQNGAAISDKACGHRYIDCWKKVPELAKKGDLTNARRLARVLCDSNRHDLAGFLPAETDKGCAFLMEHAETEEERKQYAEKACALGVPSGCVFANANASAKAAEAWAETCCLDSGQCSKSNARKRDVSCTEAGCCIRESGEECIVATYEFLDCTEDAERFIKANAGRELLNELTARCEAHPNATVCEKAHELRVRRLTWVRTIGALLVLFAGLVWMLREEKKAKRETALREDLSTDSQDH